MGQRASKQEQSQEEFWYKLCVPAMKSFKNVQMDKLEQLVLASSFLFELHTQAPPIRCDVE